MIAVIKDEYSRAIYATMIVDTSIYKNVFKTGRVTKPRQPLFLKKQQRESDRD